MEAQGGETLMTRTFKMLYGKLASLRDYDVPEAVKLGGCIFSYKKWKMTLCSEEMISKQFQCHKRFIPSAIPQWRNPLTGMNGYTFVDYVFKPDGGGDIDGAAKSSKGTKSARNRARASEPPKKIVEAELFGGLDARKITHV